MLMKIKNLVNLSALVSAMIPALGAAQAVTSDHYNIKGFTQTTYLSGPGLSGMFTVNEATYVNGKPQPVLTAYGSVSGFLPGGRLVTYSATYGDTSGWVSPSNHALKTPGSAGATFAARRNEYQLGLGGIQLISSVEGTISAESTLQDVTVVERTVDHDHYTFSLPGIGMIFSVHSNYGGKIGFNPSGVGSMIFTPTNGVSEVLFVPGTPVNSASWMGWLRSSDTTVVRS